MNLIDQLIALRDEHPPQSGAYAAYQWAIEALETIENLNALNFKLTKKQDEMETVELPPQTLPDYRLDFLKALDHIQGVVQRQRLLDE
jgi:hypothetical protein